MYKPFLILILSIFMTTTAFSQQSDTEDYKVYSALIKTEITDEIKSVAIIKSLEIETGSYWVLNALNSGDPQGLYGVYFATKNADGEEPKAPFDSATQKLMIDYYSQLTAGSLESGHFDLKQAVFLIEKLPIRDKSIDKDWRHFYKKYPGSAGVFAFSNIHYSADRNTAVFYHWNGRGGLWGHGALTTMEKTNGEWTIKYHIRIWNN